MDYEHLKDLVMAVISQVGTLGFFSSAVIYGLFWLLAKYWPGRGFQPSGPDRRLVSIAVPFLVVAAFYVLGVELGYVRVTADTLYTAAKIAAIEAFGKHLIYAVAEKRQPIGVGS